MALKENEKFFITSWFAETHEDSYEHGELGYGNCWDYHDLNFNVNKSYGSITEALVDVCRANCFDWHKENWISWFKEYGDDTGRFDGCFMVDNDNCEATDDDIKNWRNGNERLWVCNIIVNIEVRQVIPARELTADEATNF